MGAMVPGSPCTLRAFSKRTTSTRTVLIVGATVSAIGAAASAFIPGSLPGESTIAPPARASAASAVRVRALGVMIDLRFQIGVKVREK